uniref:Uncharacterized protein n=1 Tax=viral metagenome TaxID=1070528 RepID=A0A6C0KDP9_9ZZZZ
MSGSSIQIHNKTTCTAYARWTGALSASVQFDGSHTKLQDNFITTWKFEYSADSADNFVTISFPRDTVATVIIWAESNKRVSWLPQDLNPGINPNCTYMSVQIAYKRFDYFISAEEGLCNGFGVAGVHNTIFGTQGPYTDAIIPSDKNASFNCNVSSNAACSVNASHASDTTEAVNCCLNFMNDLSFRPPTGYCKLLGDTNKNVRCWSHDTQIQTVVATTLAVTVTPLSQDVASKFTPYLEALQRTHNTAAVNLCTSVSPTRGLLGCKQKITLSLKILTFFVLVAFVAIVSFWSYQYN